jgi:organic hydroperoxide reductase OsmC/OhrA
MHPYPHRYGVNASAASQGVVAVSARGLPDIATQPPPEFGGPEGFWSPESLLVAAVADCFILSFRAVARASRLEWERLDVDVEGVLDRVEGTTRFTAFVVKPRLRIGAAADEQVARAALEKAEHVCLITNSLIAKCELQPMVSIGDAAEAAAG